MDPGSTIEKRGSASPYFSICIPQYNRTSFLLKALEALSRQTCRDFEICIADDCSNDNRRGELLQFLEQSNLAYVYYLQPCNRRYDGNLRTALSLARGRYCFLHGNDDAVTAPETLALYRQDVEKYGPAGVVIPDFEDFETGSKAGRITATLNLGAGPLVTVKHYRNLSFVSGILLETAPAQSLATEKWDGSEWYQTYIACRMIASGRSLLQVERSVIRKDIKLPDEKWVRTIQRQREQPCPIKERRTPLGTLGRLVCDAVRPAVSPRDWPALVRRVFNPYLIFTYAHWVVEYRSYQSWKYALGLALGMRPGIITEGMSIPFMTRCYIRFLYTLCTVAALLVPVRLYRALKSRLYALAKNNR